ncbi:MAG: hypothetical protein IPI62_08425 [Bacteroidetes bacterium]|nr:hypothetical protein [Bacteroidota bacterium]
MKTNLLKFIGKGTLSFESIYQNKGFAADAFIFIDRTTKNDNRKTGLRFSKAFKWIKRTLSRMTYSTVLIMWFSFYFVLFGTIKLFSLIKI